MLVVIRGAGDLATGIALRLHRAGYQIVMTDLPAPTSIRRTVCFSEAIRLGEMTVEDISARKAETPEEALTLAQSGVVAVLADPAGACIPTLRPGAVVDAILAKKNLGTALTDAPVVIGVGPGFTVGTDCHAAVETMRGHTLGRTLYSGSPLPNTGIPGEIGGKSAQRLAFYVLGLSQSEAQEFAQAILDAKQNVTCCPICQNLTAGGVCSICASQKRDASIVCVVADPRDVIAIERAREFNGRYHVLHGVISPMNHIGPDDLQIKSLLDRVGQGEIKEVIMATNPDTEGEATAMYIARLLRPFGVKVTRLAYGIPVGGHLEFTDDATLARALEGRREL